MAKASIRQNFIWNAILTVSSFLFPMITYPYVQRILGPDGIGRVSFATGWVSYFVMFSQLGIPTYGVRAVAKVRDDREELTRTVHELLFINLVMTVLSYLGILYSVIFIARVRAEKPLVVLISATVFMTAVGMEWLYRGLEQYTYITIRSLACKLVALAALFCLVHTEEDTLAYGGITILASSASQILNLINARKYVSFRPVGGYHPLRHLKAVGVFFGMACANTIYTALDRVMLGFLAQNADVGYYDAAVKIKNLILSLVTSLGSVVLPRASYYVEQGLMDDFRRICRKGLSFVFLTAAPLTVYFLMYAWDGILLFSGEKFVIAVLPMQILMPTVVLIGITNVLGFQILIPTGRERVVLYSEIAGALVDMVLNLLLIPRFQSVGAAMGTLVAEIAVFAVQFGFLRQEVGDFFRAVPHQSILTGILAGSILSAGILYMPFGSFWRLAISFILFFGGYGLVLLLRKEPMTVEMKDLIVAKVKKFRK